MDFQFFIENPCILLNFATGSPFAFLYDFKLKFPVQLELYRLIAFGMEMIFKLTGTVQTPFP